jgi:hypothetical protein
MNNARWKKIVPVNTQKLDVVASLSSQQRRAFDIDSLLYLQVASMQRTLVPGWILIVSTFSGLDIIIEAIGFASYIIYFKIRRPLEPTSNESKVAASDTDPATTDVLQSDPEINRMKSSKNVNFAAYSLLNPKNIAQRT